MKRSLFIITDHGTTYVEAHLPSLGKIGKAFKLMKVAGAYWRGDSKIKCFKEYMEHAGRQKKT